MLLSKRIEMLQYRKSVLPKLKYLHYHLKQTQSYPKSTHYSSALFDLNKKPIFSLLHTKSIDLDAPITLNHGYIQAVFEPESYYLGAKYLVIEQKDEGFWFSQTLKKIALSALLALMVFMLFGWYALKLFMAPMRNSIQRLDRFIKDTTHELNTPLMTILSNIERLPTLDEKNQKKLKRIHIAAKTLSSLYDDLSFLLLPKTQNRAASPFNLSTLLKERLDYFALFMEQKELILKSTIAEHIYITSQAQAFARIIDNLLSNAIKYNRRQGSITVTLTPNRLEIADSGVGIKKEELDEIFLRYKRFNKSVGGFGIGLHIVWLIAKDLGLDIEVQSQENQGTRFIIRW